jgi:hypothetical protein
MSICHEAHGFRKESFVAGSGYCNHRWRGEYAHIIGIVAAADEGEKARKAQEGTQMTFHWFAIQVDG